MSFRFSPQLGNSKVTEQSSRITQMTTTRLDPLTGKEVTTTEKTVSRYDPVHGRTSKTTTSKYEKPSRY